MFTDELSSPTMHPTVMPSWPNFTAREIKREKERSQIHVKGVSVGDFKMPGTSGCVNSTQLPVPSHTLEG